MDIQAILEIVSQYVMLFLPAITYVITGVVAFMRLIKEWKTVKKDIDDQHEAQAITNQETNAQIAALAKDNAQLHKEVRQLTNTVNKIVE